MKTKKLHTLDDDIQIKIRIIEKSIDMYSKEIDILGAFDDERTRSLRGVYLMKVMSEKEELEKLKEQFPEYFI